MGIKAAVAGGQDSKRRLWAKRIAQWKCSGLAQRAFCAKHGLAVSTFRWWRKRLADAQRAVSQPLFIPLAVDSGAAAAASVVEVELRSGTRLRFEGEAAHAAVAALIARVR
jgi:hypothetical protein